MKLYVVAVRDNKANGYAAPMFVPTISLAERSFIDAVNTEEKTSNLWLHPEDFELWLLATFDDELGTFTNQSPPTSICVGNAVKVQKRGPSAS